MGSTRPGKRIPRSTRFCFNLDSALPSSNLCFLMFISAEIAGSRVTAMHPASASRHHSSHDRCNGPRVTRSTPLRRLEYKPKAFLLKSRAAPHHPAQFTHPNLPDRRSFGIQGFISNSTTKVSNKRLINMRWTRPDSLPSFSRANWLWCTP